MNQPPIRYSAFLSRYQAERNLEAGNPVWVEGKGGCVEGHLVMIEPVVAHADVSDPGEPTTCWYEYEVSWNRREHRKTVRVYGAAEAIQTAERIVEG